MSGWVPTRSGPANHFAIFRNVSITPLEYPYFAEQTISLDIEGFMGSLKSANPRSIFLLHACAHNPTGIDPTKEQWGLIADAMLERKHYAFFDCAYQGFASGNLDQDAWAVRYFMERGVPMLVCQVRQSDVFFSQGEKNDDWMTELCEECRTVWGTGWSFARCCSDKGGR